MILLKLLKVRLKRCSLGCQDGMQIGGGRCSRWLCYGYYHDVASREVWPIFHWFRTCRRQRINDVTARLCLDYLSLKKGGNGGGGVATSNDPPAIFSKTISVWQLSWLKIVNYLNQIVKSLVAFNAVRFGTTNGCKTWVGLTHDPSHQNPTPRKKTKGCSWASHILQHSPIRSCSNHRGYSALWRRKANGAAIDDAAICLVWWGFGWYRDPPGLQFVRS